MNPIRLGIIGCGYWGNNYIRSASELDEIDLVACCDVDTDTIEKVKNKYPSINCTSEPDKFFENPDIEAVCIVTPAGTHADLTYRALRTGKHVLVEKPFATDENFALRLVELAKSINKLLMVGHIYIYHPAGEKLRKMITNNDLGHIYHINCRRTSLGPIRSDVNVAWDLTVHDLYFIMYILDKKPSQVIAIGIRPENDSKEEMVEVVLKFPGDTLAHLHASWLYSLKQRDIVIVGSQASVIFDEINYPGKLVLIQRGKAKNPESRFQRVSVEGDAKKLIDLSGIEPLKNMILQFAISIREGKKPHSTGTDGLEVIRIMKSIENSIALGAIPVSIDKNLSGE
ncbi:MAG: Gfo/Idh/MocA family oxidoreductase [Candidatus Eremiobacteraeota bacterium]|nr:Gfo/Idh/MocA family oxidoreductase [Candidatus Eremiobacteraeota bacterium]